MQYLNSNQLALSGGTFPKYIFGEKIFNGKMLHKTED